MECPYRELPASSWWDQAVAGRGAAEIDPHLPTSLRIDREMRVVSAGSCFAQHISKALVKRGYNYLVTESAPGYLTTAQASAYGYGIFTARYGNIYTPLQLLQLVQRAYGAFEPQDQFWVNADGRCFDLLRPRIMPNGFASLAEATADLRQHLSAVRHMFENADIFIFTLGLTEGWVSKLDGAAYPTCPGCGNAGEYDPAKYVFHNFSTSETCGHLSETIRLIRQANPAIEIILTVSPVPLIATMEARHVLQANTYSKSVLRVTAEEMVRNFGGVHYFGSYEIITATRNTHVYFGDDGRTISEHAVADAMAIFFRHFCGDVSGTGLEIDTVPPGDAARPTVNAQSDTVCDEEAFYRAVAEIRAQ
jgi:hypothetical protein